MRAMYRQIGIVLLALLISAAHAGGQKAQPSDPSFGAGDTPDQAGPLATDLSPALTPDAIAKAMRKVGDWELAKTRPDFSQDWTFAALYRGFLAAADSLSEDRYRSEMLDAGIAFDWKLGPRETEADDHAIGFMYLDLYRRNHDATMLEPTKSQFDRILSMPDICTETCPDGHDRATPVWWWCDSLFMGPPVWAELYSITGRKEYLDHIDRGWWITSKLLYDQKEHLYSRDASFLNKREANGKKIFWSRGNGWVIAGLAEVLQEMPESYPSRPKYVAQFREMAARLKSVQGADGLWRPGLLNAAAYPLPEVSGSAFYVYAMAWGINHGILERAAYLPVVRKGWAGLVAHIYADGRLGSIQPIGAAPDAFKPQTSYVYGVGAFLMAGSELRHLAQGGH
jgi:unsaturated rhamnogalacturonyl hydrolase